jgi:hypothetical protein
VSRSQTAVFTGGYGPFGEWHEEVEKMLGWTGGAEIILDVNSHISLVPQFRVVGAQRGSVVKGGAFPHLGFRAFLTRAGLGMRVTF